MICASKNPSAVGVKRREDRARGLRYAVVVGSDLRAVIDNSEMEQYILGRSGEIDARYGPPVRAVVYDCQRVIGATFQLYLNIVAREVCVTTHRDHLIGAVRHIIYPGIERISRCHPEARVIWHGHHGVHAVKAERLPDLARSKCRAVYQCAVIRSLTIACIVIAVPPTHQT